MHILPILTLILGLLFNGRITCESFINLLDKIKSAVPQSQELEDYVKDNNLIPTKEGDYYQDEEGNLVIILPEGYEEGGL